MRRLQAAGLALAVALVFLPGCASGGKAPPKPPDPAEQTLAAVTEMLKLDAAQQQRTKELLKQLADRYDAIQAEWAKGKKVEPALLKASQAQFEREFTAILTPEQMRLFRETRIRMTIQAKLGGHS